MIDTLLTWMVKPRLARLERMRAEPHAAQREVLQELLQTARHTDWGRMYGYAEGLNAREFAQRVPVSSYEQLYPWIERVLRGDDDVLWPGRVQWFAKSSGTTNARSKYIPVTPQSLEDCHYRAGRDMVAVAQTLYPDAGILRGKTLSLGGTHVANPFRPDDPASRVGDVSAVIMQNLPAWAESRRTPPLELALLDEWEEKLERMARHVLHENVACLAGVPTWMIMLLRRVSELAGGRPIPEVWPNLRLFMHGAVAFGPYRELFRQLIPEAQMRYLEIYNASEGYLAFQDQPDSQDLLLLLDHGIYYEFIPLEEVGKEHPRTLTLEEVEVGPSYALVISTNAGLWRYQIGDTVRFTSVAPYRIRISGRTKHFLNAFGEEVVVENADAAIAAAAAATGALVKEYTAAPIYFSTGEGSRGGHQWLIEFTQPPASEAQFAQVLDETLRQLNSDYDAKRHRDIALKPPVLTVAAPGTFEQWLARRGKLGGQHKVPRLSNNRELLDELLS
ncbi:GH3 auxin-responsive promoter family protein [Hymenobacter latericus]|uniref:GH3 auxin-responsive promoter family protein n=1 Tax=Hymenobacter sp. YIM 151858-1 TaxID=2987688 RepID=UPI002227CBD5|nr:GH3 auxin-responsive promoter family protein [Hymenobacter sp. YIM 151858-1]UYZ58418.1 GH3 auxin-responsive promoter family protein [Hymenobacter sp. YIM 151858-1]